MSAIFQWLGAPNIPLETGKTYRVRYALPGDCAVATDADVAASLTPAGWSNVIVRQRDQAVGACRVLVEQTWPDASAELDAALNPFRGPLAASQALVIEVVDVGTGLTIYDSATGQTPPQTPRCRPDQSLVNNVCVDFCKPNETYNPTTLKCEPKLGPPPQPTTEATPRKSSAGPIIAGLAILGVAVAIFAATVSGTRVGIT